MNRNKCELIRDLLPLVKDGTASEDTVRLVERHWLCASSAGTTMSTFRTSAGGGKLRRPGRFPLDSRTAAPA